MADRDIADQLLGWWLPVDAMPDTQRRWFRDAIAAALAAARAEAKRDENEACAQVAERYGCGKPGCTECHAGAAAVEIRARMQKETT
jgi:uncharacterized membrane protein